MPSSSLLFLSLFLAESAWSSTFIPVVLSRVLSVPLGHHPPPSQGSVLDSHALILQLSQQQRQRGGEGVTAGEGQGSSKKWSSTKIVVRNVVSTLLLVCASLQPLSLSEMRAFVIESTGSRCCHYVGGAIVLSLQAFEASKKDLQQLFSPFGQVSFFCCS